MRLFELVTDIAAALNERIPDQGFQTVDRFSPNYKVERWGEIRASSGRTIIFYSDHYDFDRARCRLTVSGRYARSQSGDCYQVGHGEELPVITVAARRTAAAIAGDIARRFWPEYESYYEKSAAWAKQWDAIEERQKGYVQMLAEAGGGCVTQFGRAKRYGFGKRPGYEAQVSSDGQVKLVLEYLDIEMACEVVRLVSLEPEA